MRRLWVPVLALACILMAQSARAQMPAPTVAGSYGMHYSQPLPSNSYLLDRWWQVQSTPGVPAMMPPATLAERSAPMQPATTRRGRRPARMSVRPYGYTMPQPAMSLPTGSLYWPGAANVRFYSPAQRYTAYGQGYGISPYGSADYGAQYKGMYWGGY